MHFHQLETERLHLKGISTEVMKQIFNELPKEEIKLLLGHRSEEEYLKEEYKHLNNYASYNRGFILFLLIDKTTSKIIGRCGIHNWNQDHKRAEIGYMMEEADFKRKGLMTEALKAIIPFGFKNMQLHRLEATVSPNNIPSLQLMKKFHFRKEGVLREHYFVEGKFEDNVMFSILHNEYKDE